MVVYYLFLDNVHKLNVRIITVISCTSIPCNGKLAKESEIPIELRNRGSNPVTHNGQKPVIRPPIAPTPDAIPASAHLFLSLYLIYVRTEVIATKNPMVRERNIDKESLTQSIVFA